MSVAPALPSTTEPPDLALVLSGGGARGFAHIGALQVLNEIALPFDLVVGVSMGSIIGAGYAAGFTPAQMTDLAQTLRVRSVFRPRPGRQCFADSAGLRAAIHSVFGDRHFKDLERPLLVVSSSVLRGEPFVFSSGPLVDALVASCSIPLLFAPVAHEGHHLLDGGMIDGLPLGLVRRVGARRVVAVDASSHARMLLELPVVRQTARGVVRVLARRRPPDVPDTLDIFHRTLHHASQPRIRPPADVLIRPAFGYRTTYHYRDWPTMIARGRAAAEAARPALEALGTTAAAR
ncbi:MAG: patatin-like phospholipase family protein [Chloroflexota bacterium]